MERFIEKTLRTGNPCTGNPTTAEIAEHIIYNASNIASFIVKSAETIV